MLRHYFCVTVFVLINAQVAQHFTSPKNDVLWTKYEQTYKNVSVLEPILMTFGHPFL